MKKILHTIYTRLLLVGLAAFALTSCVDDELVKSGEVVEGIPITVTFNIGGIPTTDVTVNTRADDNSLSDLNNLVIFVFRQDGSLEHYVSSRPNNDITFTKQSDGLYKVSFKTTSGTKNLIAVANTSQNTADGGFWELTEIQDAVTSGHLTFDELKGELISLRSSLYTPTAMQPIQIVSISQMMMAGWNTNVTFNTNGTVDNYGTDGDNSKNVIVKMDRTMARITFNIKEGNFVPTSYRVYNIPTKSYLTNKEENNSKRLTSSILDVKYIHFASSKIGAISGDSYSFSFYIPENIQETKTENKEGDEIKYVDRDKWQGTSGSIAEQKTWLNAPQNSTFVEISGTYSGNSKVDGTGTEVTGVVKYTIHLGDFSSLSGSMGNFSVERNVSYTYNVTVEGVNNIIVEATTDKPEGDEQQPGAEGDIYDNGASVYNYNLDAHYEQVYLEYNLSEIAKAVKNSLIDTYTDEQVKNAIAGHLILSIQSDAMNGRVSLQPYKLYANAGSEDEAATAKKNAMDGIVDYKWIEFYPQTSTQLAPYPGTPSWSQGYIENVTTPTTGENKLKVESMLDVYDVIVAMGRAIYDIFYSQPVDNYGIQISGDGINNDYTARFTAFVNEYYYYKDPLTDTPLTSWEKAINKKPREMIIAMSSDVSLDGNSSYSMIHSYISQLSIETFYNPNTDLNGFGIETYNETPLTIGFGTSKCASDPSVLDDSDGRSNQLKLIGGIGHNQYNWNYYINYGYNGWYKSVGTDYKTHKLGSNSYKQGDYENGAAYAACLSRNRDLNGNGVIDDNEVRWYLPSINEYIRIAIGVNAISNAARLYMGDKSEMTKGTGSIEESSSYPSLYIKDGSLYYTSSNDKEVFWAVEKGSYSKRNQYYDDSPLPIRCIRALPGKNSGITNVSTKSAASYEYFKNNNDGMQGLKFKDRLVGQLYRQRIDGSLNTHNEGSPENSFSAGIFVASEDFYEEDTDWWGWTYKVYQTYSLGSIIGYKNFTKVNPCETYKEGKYTNWRVPNLVELSAMKAAGLLTFKTNTACCTQFSNLSVRYGFVYNTSDLITCPGTNEGDIYSMYRIRCVRDVPADYFGN